MLADLSARSRGAGDRLLEMRGAVLVKRSAVCPLPAPPHWRPGSYRRGQSAWKISIYLAAPPEVYCFCWEMVVLVLVLPLLPLPLLA
jgi:hypothetical protein